jgi:6-phosphogluconolactonase
MLTLVPLALGISGQAAAQVQAEEGNSRPDSFLAYVGTYTRGSASEGIYIFRLKMDSAALAPVGVRDSIENPSFLAVDPTHRYLYAVSEVGNAQGSKMGAVAAYAIDPDSGKLQPLNQQLSGGAGPCHLVVDKTGANVLVANYGGGSVAVLPTRPDGGLEPATCVIQHEGSSINARRQSSPHAHSINLDPANRFAFVADLGLDKILIYRFDAQRGTLTAHDPPFVAVQPGAGPRHFAFHPSGQYAYVINELHSTVTAFRYDVEAGTLETLQTVSTLPTQGADKNSTAEIVVHPTGQFLYGSNRGHDSIAIFAVDPQSGRLTPRGHESTRGKTPRNFAIDPSGTYLVAENQSSDSLVVFRIDRRTGTLSDTGVAVEVPSPVCIKMIP